MHLKKHLHEERKEPNNLKPCLYQKQLLTNQLLNPNRDQQDEIQNNVMKVRVLKNRYSGDTGIACNLIYNKETGRLTEGTFDE